MKVRSPTIVFVAVLASLLEIIDTSIVNVALPTMMGSLGATLEDISMVVTGYVIANAIVLPASSWLSEKFGRRRYFLGCIAGFTLASVLCGMAPNLWMLIIFRIFQGAMGGALLPTSQTLIFEQFPPEEAGLAGAIFGMSVMVGPTLGPVLGGFLTDQYGWRSIFYINLPLGLLAIFVGLTCISDRPHEEGEVVAEKPFDFVGLVLLILGIGCMQFVLERGQADDWFSSRAIMLDTAIAVICLPSFVLWELFTENPMINIRLFKERVVSCGTGLVAGLGVFLYSVVFILPVFMDRTYHFDATEIGLFFIPGSILTAMLMPFVGKAMASGMNPKILIAIGLLGIEATLLALTGLSSVSTHSQILNCLYLRGFALAFLFVPINASILSQFRGERMAQVSGLLNLFRQVGGSVGIALSSTLLTQRMHQNYVNLSSHVSLLNANTKAQYYGLLQSMAHQMSANIGMATSRLAALKLIQFRMMNQAFVLSFIDLMWVLMALVFLTAIPWTFIKFRKVHGGASAAMAAH